MIKIYIAGNSGENSDSLVLDYIKQTPNNKGKWGDICYTLDYREADFLIIHDNISSKKILKFFPKNRIIYISREALDSKSINKFPIDKCVHFSFWDKSGYLPVKWIYGHNKSKKTGYSGLNLTYDELKALKPNKERLISSFVSEKKYTDGHKIRLNFLEHFSKGYNLIDNYGTNSNSNTTLSNNEKKDTLLDYKYSLGFDNQDSINDFFGTQFTDAMLCWTVPIFWCGTDLLRYFPGNSFIQFNARNVTEIKRISSIISEKDYLLRIDDISKARDLILDKYNFWPTVENIILNIK